MNHTFKAAAPKTFALVVVACAVACYVSAYNLATPTPEMMVMGVVLLGCVMAMFFVLAMLLIVVANVSELIIPAGPIFAVADVILGGLELIIKPWRFFYPPQSEPEPKPKPLDAASAFVILEAERQAAPDKQLKGMAALAYELLAPIQLGGGERDPGIMPEQRLDDFVSQLERQQREITRQLAEIKDRLDLIDRKVTHFWDKTMMAIAAGFSLAAGCLFWRGGGDAWSVGVASVLTLSAWLWVLHYGFPTHRNRRDERP
jgi:hypothetical protein